MSPDILIEALKAVLLGLVEGITEWLPISSTGHMILVDEFVQLNVSPEFLVLFLVVIQIGSIMAVIVSFFHKLNPFSSKKTHEEQHATWRMWGMVAIGCIPAAVFGILFDEWVNQNLYNAWVVAAMLIVYGVIFIIIEARNRRRELRVLSGEASIHGEVRGKHARIPAIDPEDPDALDKAMFKVTDPYQIDWKTAIKIGLFQCLAIIPGTSRSGATIIGGMLCGCSRTAAAEFTFFLAIPVCFGWGMVRAIRYMLNGLVMTQTEIVVLIVGTLTAFIMGVIAIRFLMGYIKKNDFTIFGVYRIIIGVVVLAYFGAQALGVF